jgi:hypothetical protein
MLVFRIVPRGGEFWIEAEADNGSRRFLERFSNEDAAKARLRWLEDRAAAIQSRIEKAEHKAATRRGVPQ